MNLPDNLPVEFDVIIAPKSSTKTHLFPPYMSKCVKNDAIYATKTPPTRSPIVNRGGQTVARVGATLVVIWLVLFDDLVGLVDDLIPFYNNIDTNNDATKGVLVMICILLMLGR